MCSQNILYFSPFPCSCVPLFHECQLWLIWNRAPMKVPETSSSSSGPLALLGGVQIRLEVYSDLGQAGIYLGFEESSGIIQLNV